MLVYLGKLVECYEKLGFKMNEVKQEDTGQGIIMVFESNPHWVIHRTIHGGRIEHVHVVEDAKRQAELGLLPLEVSGALGDCLTKPD